MNKKEVAEFLGVSKRAVERYAEKGKLSVKLQKGKRGDEAIYVRDEVEKLKTEFDRRRNRTQGAVISSKRIEEVSDRLIASIETQATGSKLLLTLTDCQRLTGLSENYLSEAIESGELTARIIEDVSRVRRADLDAFINSIYNPRRQRG